MSLQSDGEKFRLINNVSEVIQLEITLNMFFTYLCIRRKYWNFEILRLPFFIDLYTLNVLNKN